MHLSAYEVKLFILYVNKFAVADHEHSDEILREIAVRDVISFQRDDHGGSGVWAGCCVLI